MSEKHGIVTIDGNQVNDLNDLYEIITRQLLPHGFQIINNLDSFNDVLVGGFGVYGVDEPFDIYWINSAQSYRVLGEKMGEIVEIISNHPHIRLFLK